MKYSILTVASLFTLSLAACGGSDETPSTAAQATAALSASSAPAAGSPRGKGGRMFARFDANHDGKLQQSEVPAEMWSHVSVADANADGAVTEDELRTARQQGKIQPPEGRGQGGRMFARFDANHDGKLQQSEVPADVWSHISVADTNADGAVTEDELRAAHQQGKIQRPEGRGQGPRR